MFIIDQRTNVGDDLDFGEADYFEDSRPRSKAKRANYYIM